jgi:hypothetical protein
MDRCQGSSVPEGVCLALSLWDKFDSPRRDKKLTPVQEIDTPSVPTAEFEDEDDLYRFVVLWPKKGQLH